MLATVAAGDPFIDREPRRSHGRKRSETECELLRKIIRSVDKRLEYSFIDPGQEGRFSLRLSIRGRAGTVSLLTDDLRQAVADDVRKNAIRQKIKGTRDHLLSNYVVDVMGRRMARILKESAGGKEESRPSFFYRRPQGRR